MNAIGIDLGATKIALAKYDSKTWEKLDETQVPTASNKGVESVIEQLVELIKKYQDKETKYVGIGVPGPTAHGKIFKLPNIQNSKNIDLQKILNEKLSTIDPKPTTTIFNDANCFTIGAWKLSTYKDKQNIIGLTIGTGVGGGIIANGNLVTGKQGKAGEFGHEIIREGKTLEDLISGPALSKRWNETFREEKSGKEIVEQAKKGEKKARDFLKNVGKDLGIALKNIILSFDPEVILIGGSASAALPYYKESIQEKLFQNVFKTPSQIPIERSTNADCATFGAAWLAIINS